MKTKFKKLSAGLLVALMIVQLLFITAPVASADSANGLLIDLTTKVTQDNIEIEEGKTIEASEPLTLDIVFSVPLMGLFTDSELESMADGSMEVGYIQAGDYVDFNLSEYFTMSAEDLNGKAIYTTIPQDFLGEGDPDADMTIEVARLSYVEEDGCLVARLTFGCPDGTDDKYNVFNSRAFLELPIELEFNLLYSDEESSDGQENTDIILVGKSYTLHTPAPDTDYVVEKTGSTTATDGWYTEITWTVNIYGKVDDEDIGGTVFSDDLTSVGEFVSGSFTVGGKSVADEDLDIEGNTISYTLPDGTTAGTKDTGSPVVITFKTKIPESAYYEADNANKKKEISNTASVKYPDVEDVTGPTVTATGKVEFTVPKLITKTGSKTPDSIFPDENGKWTITWIVELPAVPFDRTNVTITDALPDGLSFKSAQWQVHNGTDWENVVGEAFTYSSIPTDNGYKIASVAANAKYRLVITTETPEYDYVLKTVSYTNKATVKWYNGPGTAPKAEATVTTGYSSLDKSGAVDSNAADVIEWTLTFDGKSQLSSIISEKLVIYDLILHGTSLPTGASVSDYTLPVGLSLSSLTARAYNQKLVAPSIESDARIKSYDVTNNSETVGTLLVIEIEPNAGDDLSTPDKYGEYEYSFQTQVTDGSKFTGVKNTIANTAYLYNGAEQEDDGTGDVTYKNSTKKGALKRAAAANIESILKDNPSGDISSYVTQTTTTTNEGKAQSYNYEENYVIYRIEVTVPGNLAGVNGLTATLTDTLPDGWVFKPFADGSDYVLLSGTTRVSNTSSIIIVPQDGKNPVDSVNSDGLNQREFTMKMNQSYVILLKAGLDDGEGSTAAKDFFSKNQQKTFTNNVSMVYKNSSGNVLTTLTDKCDVIVKSEILDKNRVLTQPGIIEWTVDYKAYDFGSKGTKIVDTLPVGIDLRVNSKGELILDYISASKLIIGSNGTVTVGDPVQSLSSYVSYNNETRELTFNFPDASESYRFVYLTDITGNAGDSVKNSAALHISGKDSVETVGSYRITSADVTASLLIGGNIVVSKLDGESDKALSNARFTLYARVDDSKAESGFKMVPIRTGITAVNGKVTLRGLPAGEYTLMEDRAPNRYVLSKMEYQVTVTQKTVGGNSVFEAVIVNTTATKANEVTYYNYLQNTVGDLVVEKLVSGNNASKSTEFEFVVTFGSVPIEGYSYKIGGSWYVYTTDDPENDPLVVKLKHGEALTVTDIPVDTEYAVVETNANKDGYTTTVTGDTEGIIDAGQTEVVFTNSRYSSGGFDPDDKDTDKDDDDDEDDDVDETDADADADDDTDTDTNPDVGDDDDDDDDSDTDVEVTPPVIINPGDELPDPNDPDSPDEFFIFDEDGTPLGHFTKVEQDDGTFLYIDDDGIPLAGLPATGDGVSLTLLAVIIALLLLGIAAVLLVPKTKAHR